MLYLYNVKQLKLTTMPGLGIFLTLIGTLLCPIFTLGCVLIHFDLVGVGIFAIVVSILSLSGLGTKSKD
jgi:hypothetical protein